MREVTLSEATEGRDATSFQAALIDVLIRGLETAKQRIEAGDDPKVIICPVLYYNHGETCGLLYIQ